MATKIIEYFVDIGECLLSPVTS